MILGFAQNDMPESGCYPSSSEGKNNGGHPLEVGNLRYY